MAPNAKLAQAFHTKTGAGNVFLRWAGDPAETKVPGATYSGATEATMSRIDPWEKAADCERAIQAAADPQQKTILKNLRYLWIALANESECMSADEFAHESETIGRLHIALARSRSPSLH